MILQIMTDNISIEGGSDGSIRTKISSDQYNGISLSEDGALVASKGKQGKPGTGSTMNKVGNSIAGNASQTVSVLRCNSSVSRRQLGDPDPSNEGIYMQTVIDKILNSGV